ncbi:MAG: alpha/beta fold hydrolase [Thermomicrobiales bacterium]|nr:alpha/beta fold hydrolase [Thermomicrobiales bacterium]
MRAHVNGVDLYFDIEGSGLVPNGPEMAEREVCFVLHGGPGMDHTYFKPWLSPLAENMQLIYVDHRGTGRSGPAPFETCTIEQMADDVEALRQHLGLGNVSVMGNSFGGFWALTYALRHPESLNRLILITTSPSHEFYDAAKAEAARKGTPEQIAAVPDVFEGKITSDDEFARWWEIMNPLYYYRWDEKYKEGGARAKPNPALASHMFREYIPSYDVRPRLAEIDAPTLILGGRHDWVTPVGQSELMAASIPDNEFVVFEESGHLPFVEEQERFLDVVNRFMRFTTP